MGRSQDVDVLVVGAGVSGLTTAVRLGEAGARVRVVARERSPYTTSDVAAAIWYPFHAGPPGRALGWAATSYRVLRDLVAAPEAGVTLVEGLEAFRRPVADEPWWRPAVPSFRRARADELVPGAVDGFVFEAPVIEMPRYLAWLAGRVELAGVFEAREVQDVDALFAEAPVVVNCTGLAAAALVGDDRLVPIRGQVVRVAPGFAKRFVQDADREDALTYIIPRPDCTVLGGTAEVGAWDLTPDPGVAETILARAIALEPRLAGAEVLSHAVGLRPGRHEVRLEAEARPGGRLIHNYGHGGAGVTLSWGCAAEAAALALGQEG